LKVQEVSIPKLTYVSVPMAIIRAGGRVQFENTRWRGLYQLKPYPLWDSARYFTSGMYRKGQIMCLSFRWGKILALGQGGAILHDDAQADGWFRKARFNGRTAGVDPREDTFVMGYPFNMMPRDAAEGLTRLSYLPRHNKPLPNDDCFDLSKLELWRSR
jgi:DegT/DnrJ/EryC1/StrS aminotransferase family